MKKTKLLTLILSGILSYTSVTPVMASGIQNVGSVSVQETSVFGFKDINEYDWYYNAVQSLAEKGIMTGLNSEEFGPQEIASRAEFATILYRMENQPSVNYHSVFSDVADGQYYSKAVVWANQEGIIKGYGNGKFGPSDQMTREQLVTMMHRYAMYKNYDMEEGDFSEFPDRENVTDFAKEAMSWSVAVGLIKGDQGKLNPQGSLNRAVTATVVERFLEAYVEEKVYTVKQDGTGNFRTIQEAVNKVQPGETVEVYGGIYREEVVLPQGGTDEEHRITIKAAEGEEVTITGAEIVPGSSWVYDESTQIYELKLEREFFGLNAESEYFNPFAERWMSKGSRYTDYFTCGCVYINDQPMAQQWSVNDVVAKENSWYAVVDETTGETTIYANFGGEDPRNEKNIVEVNKRMQCITAAWNQGYITVDGFEVMKGCGPKTIDFWMTTAEAMYGAIATNGGYHWIIENCEVTQCRGVAIDFGSGSCKQENKYGGEPEKYGYHIIRYCNVHDNGTNGMMAYRGAYTEIHNNVLANNNALNTGLLSEAYIKDVSGGWGINIHDNYLYSDQEWSARPIWLDSECDGSIVSNNIIYDANNGFTYVDLECNAGWLLVSNNILVGTGWGTVLNSHAYLVNNLILDAPSTNVRWGGNSSTAMPGAEGYDGYSRAMRIMEPGTLHVIGEEETSRFETYNRFNKLMGNIFLGQGPVSAKKSGEALQECTESEYQGVYTQVYLNPDQETNKDYSGGCWKDPVANEKYKGKLAWIPVAGEETLGLATQYYGNECDYNLYCAGAQGIDEQYATARGYLADQNSVVTSGGSYQISGDADFFKLTLVVDSSMQEMEVPVFTGEYLGAATCYQQEGYNFLAPDVNVDFFGNSRGSTTTIAGPFAELKTGTNTFELWSEDKLKAE